MGSFFGMQFYILQADDIEKAKKQEEIKED